MTRLRQNPSATPATLTFDLEFDTAEGDASGQPVDVRDLTKAVRQFVEPPKDDARGGAAPGAVPLGSPSTSRASSPS